MTITPDAPIKTLTTLTFSVDGTDLSNALASVIPFSGRDDTLPALTGVLLSFRPNAWHSTREMRLVLAATDRYTLGTDYCKIEQVEDLESELLLSAPMDALISWRECDQLAKRLRKVNHPVLISVTRNDRSQVTTVTVNDYSISSTHQVMDHQFPQWERLMPEGPGVDVTADGIATVAFNREYMAKFAKVATAPKTTPMQLSWHGDTDPERKPLKVTIGDSFVGLIMPVKLS